MKFDPGPVVTELFSKALSKSKDFIYLNNSVLFGIIYQTKHQKNYNNLQDSSL